MGLSFRKSFKFGKNTRINLSKTGGIGLSTGVKGARVSVNKQGIRTQVGSNGVYYRKQYGINNNVDKNGMEIIDVNGLYNLPKELKAQTSKKQWILVLTGFFSVVIGFQIIGFMLVGMVFLIWSLFCKDSRYSFKYSKATINFVKGNFDKALINANKAKNIKDTEQVNKLIELIIERDI